MSIVAPSKQDRIALHRLWVVSALLLFVGASFAGEGKKNVLLLDLAPLQTDVGFASGHEKAQEWIQEAKRLSQAGGGSVHDELVKILNREGRASFDAYVSPDGKVRPDDGHHKVVAAQEVMNEYKIEPGEVKWSVNIQGDYSKKSWKKFAKDMNEKGLGYFSKEVLAQWRASGRPLEELYHDGLPDDFSKVRNSPMRSALGKFYDLLGIQGSALKPYSQFHLGEEMAEAGVEVKPGEEFSPEVQARLHMELYEGAHSQALQKALLSSVRPERRAEIEGKIKAGQERLEGFQSPDAKASKGEKLACVLRGVGGLLSKVATLPSIIPLPSNPNLYHSLFGRAQSRFNQEVDPDRVKKLIDDLSKGDTSDISRGDINYLKEVRKKALGLRGAYRFLSVDHDPPPLYKDFVKDLGALNDEISRWNPRKKPGQDLIDAAKTVKGRFKDEDLFDFDFSVSTPEGFLKDQGQRLDVLNKTVHDPHLIVDQYHDIRKVVRDYMYLFELLSAETHKPEYVSAFDFTSRISKKMGRVKDGLLVDVKKSSHPRGDDPTSIDPDTLQELNQFIDVMKKTLAEHP